MIDRIIDLYYDNNKEDISLLFNDVLSSNNPLYIYAFAYYFPEYKLDILTDAIINTNSPQYINYFFSNIDNTNEDIIIDKILEFDCKTIFYSLYIKRNAKDISYIKAFKKMLENKKDTYKNLLLYDYFISKDRFNEELLMLSKEIIPNITKDNYKELITKLVNDNKEPVLDDKRYSQNIYKGHNGHIPNIIVCHRTFDYGRTIMNFHSDIARVSSTFATSQNGDYIQFLSFEDSPWSNGTSTDPDSPIYYRHSNIKQIRETNDNANYYTFSIENESFDGSLSEAQYQTVVKLACKIIDYYEETTHEKFMIDREHIIGHKDVNPLVRTHCPGDKFPLERLINDLKEIYK